jgi:hypothetical protein
LIALVVRSFGRAIYPLVSLTALLAVSQLALIAAAAELSLQGNFERLAQLIPAFALQAFGTAFTTFDGMVTLAYFEPLLVMLVVQFAIHVAAEPASDVERSIVDIVLARPLARHWIVTRSFAVMLGSTLVLTGGLTAATWAGLWWLAPAGAQWPSPGVIVRMALYMTAIAVCFGAATLAASGWARRRGTAQGTVAVAAIGAYLLELVGMLWAPLRGTAQISPFHYFRGAAILSGTADPWRDFSVFGSLTLMAMVVAYWRYQRRDL